MLTHKIEKCVFHPRTTRNRKVGENTVHQKHSVNASFSAPATQLYEPDLQASGLQWFQALFVSHLSPWLHCTGTAVVGPSGYHSCPYQNLLPATYQSHFTGTRIKCLSRYVHTYKIFRLLYRCIFSTLIALLNNPYRAIKKQSTSHFR